MRQILTVDHGNRERAAGAGPASWSRVAPCSAGRRAGGWASPGNRSRGSPLPCLRAAIPEARVLVEARAGVEAGAVVEEGGPGASPWRRASVGLPDRQLDLGLDAPI